MYVYNYFGDRCRYRSVNTWQIRSECAVSEQKSRDKFTKMSCKTEVNINQTEIK